MLRGILSNLESALQRETGFKTLKNEHMVI